MRAPAHAWTPTPPTARHHLTADEVRAIHAEVRAAARAGHDRLDVAARTDLYSGLAVVALLDHRRGGRVTPAVLRSLARHSPTAHRVRAAAAGIPRAARP